MFETEIIICFCLSKKKKSAVFLKPTQDPFWDDTTLDRTRKYVLF